MSDRTPRLEYERRFLVTDASILEGHPPEVIAQAFLFSRAGWTVRVRRTFHRRDGQPDTDEAPVLLAIKGPRKGAARLEMEWEIPQEVAIELFRGAEMKVFKSRYQLVESNDLWDVDVFHMMNDGLIIAECELSDSSRLDTIAIPSWCGDEVTGDVRYNNEELARHPYALWKFIY